VALVYFDSSALVKLMLDEPGSDLAAELWNGCDAALSSRLAYPEVRRRVGPAAPRRRRRSGLVSRTSHARLKRSSAAFLRSDASLRSRVRRQYQSGAA